MIAKNDREIFQRAFSFVRDPARLLQNGFMREPPVFGDEPEPPAIERACSVGWLMHCGAEQYGEMIHIFDAEAIRMGGDETEGLSGFNDERSHAEVVALWERVGKREGWL